MELRLPAPSLVILVGPSGSGKTTWALEHFAPNAVVSSDSLRAMVGAGEDDQTASAAAFGLLEAIVTERLVRGLTTVIDTLGFDSESRQRWIGLAHDNDTPAHAVYFDTDPTICEERNEARARSIPKTVLRRQFTRFKAVRSELDDEDWDGVHREQTVATVSPLVAGAVEDEPMTAVSGDAHRVDLDGSGVSQMKLQPARRTGNPGFVDRGHTFGLIVSRFDWETPMGPTLAAIAQRAEVAGFRDIWVMDHFRQIRGVGRPWEDIPEAYTALGFMAGATSTIRLGAMVTGITHRNPVILGKMLASLDVLSGGRAICGLGIGWDKDEHAAYGIDYPSTATRYEMLEETLDMLPLLWGKGSPEFHGKHVDAAELICYPRPIQEPIPILIGGSGEKKTLRLVARYADACNVFGDPDRVRHKVEVLTRHCVDFERDPAEVEVTHLTTALVAPDRPALREQVESLRDRNTPAEQFMTRNNAGTVDDLETLFRKYHDAGAQHSIVALSTVAEPDSIELFGDVITAMASP